MSKEADRRFRVEQERNSGMTTWWLAAFLLVGTFAFGAPYLLASTAGVPTGGIGTPKFSLYPRLGFGKRSQMPPAGMETVAAPASNRQPANPLNTQEVVYHPPAVSPAADPSAHPHVTLKPGEPARPAKKGFLWFNGRRK
jgi:hypothetical protein